MARSHLTHANGPRLRAVTFCRRPATAFGLGLLLITLILAPLLFSSSTLGAFEFPKIMLLTATAIFALALGVCALVRPRDPAPAAEGSPSSAFAVRRKPLSVGFALFLLSAAVSTAASISPLTSLLGTHESHAGLWTIAVYTMLFFAVRGL